MRTCRRTADFQLVAGDPALDFVNTVDWRWDPRRPEGPARRLQGVLRRVGPGRSGIVTAAGARALTAAARRDPRSASRALQRSRHLREALGRIFEAAVKDARPAPRDLRLAQRVPRRGRCGVAGSSFAGAATTGPGPLRTPCRSTRSSRQSCSPPPSF